MQNYCSTLWRTNIVSSRQARRITSHIVRPCGEQFMNNKWHWYIYVIECLDGTYYTGMTWNLPNRLEQHISKLGAKYTRKHGVKALVYHEEFDNLEQARNREIQIKGWNREKKRKLISGEWGKEWR